MRKRSLQKIVIAGIAGMAGMAATGGMAFADAPQEGRGGSPEKRREVFVRRLGPGGELLLGRGFLGVGLVEMTPELRAHFGAPDDAGVLVSKVEEGSPAASAGLKVGDIVTTVDGEKVDNSWEATAAIRKREAGDTVSLQVIRDGRSLDLNATIAERERPEIDLAPMFWKDRNGEGMVIQLDPEKLQDFQRFRVEIPEGAEGPRILRLREREEELEKRLKELEKRLAELEGRLKKN